MWLSEKRKTTYSEICSGIVTIGGETAAVMTDCEKRGASVCSPGGYIWRPCENDKVIVMKNGDAILGIMRENDDTQPGEVRIFSAGGAEIILKNDGTIHITGDVYIDGSVRENGA